MASTNSLTTATLLKQRRIKIAEMKKRVEEKVVKYEKELVYLDKVIAMMNEASNG